MKRSVMLSSPAGTRTVLMICGAGRVGSPNEKGDGGDTIDVSSSRTMGGREYTVAVLVLQGPGRHHYGQLIRLHLACMNSPVYVRVPDSR